VTARLTARALFLRRVAEDRSGVTVVEFALVAPVFLLLLMGIFDIGHMAYVRSVLQGAVQQVARSATLETADTATGDDYVRKVVEGVAPGAKIDITRSSYYDFTDIARPEVWSDKNNNGRCDNGEAYTDENGNGQWDADIGKSGNGGANDIVVYKVSVTYKPLFPVPGLTDRNATRTLAATAVKKNQPFALQTEYGSAAGTCK